MSENPLALVVGANRGIGLGVTKAFMARGWDVIATARAPEAAADLRALAAGDPGRVEILPLDMADPAGVDAFAASLSGRTLDVVLVNAGVAGPAHHRLGPADGRDPGDYTLCYPQEPHRDSHERSDSLSAQGRR